MNGTTIEKAALTKAALTLLDEAYIEAPNPKGTWFADNEAANGFLGTVGSIGASQASRPLEPGDGLTVASHVGHLRFALSLANRAAKGENPYAEAKWARSWDARGVSEAQWRDLVEGLRAEYAEFRTNVESGVFLNDEDSMTGLLATIAHGAWHLGAIRQGLGRIGAPK